jgi:hypothetical protein
MLCSLDLLLNRDELIICARVRIGRWLDMMEFQFRMRLAGPGTSRKRQPGAQCLPDRKMTFLRKMMLTHLVGWPYNPLTQRGRRAAGAKKFALVLSKESRASDTRTG